jgi:hypothetical protein
LKPSSQRERHKIQILARFHVAPPELDMDGSSPQLALRATDISLASPTVSYPPADAGGTDKHFTRALTHVVLTKGFHGDKRKFVVSTHAAASTGA